MTRGFGFPAKPKPRACAANWLKVEFLLSSASINETRQYLMMSLVCRLEIRTKQSSCDGAYLACRHAGRLLQPHSKLCWASPRRYDATLDESSVSVGAPLNDGVRMLPVLDVHPQQRQVRKPPAAFWGIFHRPQSGGVILVARTIQGIDPNERVRSTKKSFKLKLSRAKPPLPTFGKT